MPDITKEQAETVLLVLMNSTPNMPLHQSIGAVGIMQSIVQGTPIPEAEEPVPKNGKKKGRK